ncbi:putative protein phosphatase 2C 4-like, partial [Tropilaelaps mercedesae]
VSKYCSLHLPNFIKGLSSYQAGDCKEALIDAFVKFDQTLTKPEVVEVLRQLAQDVSDSDGTVETDEDERVVLAREAAMPLEDLIRSYKSHQDHKEDSEEELLSEGGNRAGVDEDEDVEVFDSDVPGSGSGSTAVVALLKGDVLTVANAGDSRAVLCREGKAIDLSVDHKPEDAAERTRIERAGGKVTGDGRVNGGLNLSRAIGDHVYKQNEDLTLQEQMISPLPDVQTIMLDRSKDNFLVLACDGIWNCMTSQEVCDFVTACLRHGDNVGKICEQLFRKCIAPDTSGDGTGCDNMTCIIVRLNTESLQDDQKTGSQQVTETSSTEATRCNGAGETQNNKRKSEDEQPSKRSRASS